MAVNVYASATEDGTAAPWTSGSVTIDCPDVGSRLTAVPEDAAPEVDRELALLDEQIAAAYARLQESAQAVRQDAGFADDAVMNPLKEKRGATIERITVALDRTGDRPEGLEDLAACTLRTDERQADGDAGGEGNQGQDQNQNQGQNQGQGQDGGQQGNGGQAGNGPVAADYADITTVQPSAQNPPLRAEASRGTFVTSCGVNENGLFNSDNVIVAPGVSNGAHHFHDYIGNQANDAFASDDDLANADTSCVDQGDKSSYYWPVLRLQNGTQEQDANAPGGGIEGNAGEIVTPKEVTLTFVGNPTTEVTAMPRLLRIITGDAKAFVNGTANANASWSCTGFEDRQLKDKYPLCPDGSDVVRTFRFQSCWDGDNIDSANHRTHVAFAGPDGACPAGFQAIPQLVQRIVYDVDAPSLEDGGRTTPLFAVDAFPEQLHKPVTDHGDFINVFGEDLMNEMVGCINDGRTCGAGTGGGDGAGEGGDGGQDQDTGQDQDAGQGQNQEQGGNQGPDQNQGQDEGQGRQPPAQNPEAPQTGPAAGDVGAVDVPRSAEPRAYGKATTNPKAAPKADPQTGPKTDATTDPDQDQAAAPAPDAAPQEEIGAAATAPQQTPPPADAGDTPVVTAPQAQGGLAETGADLWPAAAGGLLVIGGFVLLRRTAARRY
ncbi:DUF1996 domain-containing protein [Streptomyces sp. A012304]|uniref:DUF1996 domain-containing protein n=1 Tax=Streptomyces sp. A012304 TaxID=375446 RepID=UPI00223043D5|nr:DUF1996 domain-containing protein [Streptomyces sp. A012304]